MKKKSFFSFILFFIFIFQNNALVSVGGYSAFGRSTQKETDGTRNTTSFHPMISFNTIIPTGFWGQIFLPEAGMVFHSSEYDGYSKKTTFLLLDLGYQIAPQILFRYGLGTFITSIKGDGGTMILNNGNSTDEFYRPSENGSSYNTTLDLGLEYAYDSNYAFRFQTYLFSGLSSEARKLSYSLSLNYYL